MVIKVASTASGDSPPRPPDRVQQSKDSSDEVHPVDGGLAWHLAHSHGVVLFCERGLKGLIRVVIINQFNSSKKSKFTHQSERRIISVPPTEGWNRVLFDVQAILQDTVIM